MNIRPYVFFDGKCAEALDFYKQTLGAEIKAVLRYKDHPGGIAPSGQDDKVMHAELRIGETDLMASDGMCGGSPKFEGVSLCLYCDTGAEAEQKFSALAQGGQVQMPMEASFFADKFGMVADKFGVHWMLIGGAKNKPA